jgi:flagellar biosynthesis/type III secretory pathway protein FliH
MEAGEATRGSNPAALAASLAVEKFLYPDGCWGAESEEDSFEERVEANDAVGLGGDIAKAGRDGASKQGFPFQRYDYPTVPDPGGGNASEQFPVFDSTAEDSPMHGGDRPQFSSQSCWPEPGASFEGFARSGLSDEGLKSEDRDRILGFDQGLKRGRELGHEAGMEQGLRLGREQGVEEGLEQGHAQGLELGLAQGREEGRTEGRTRGFEEGSRHLEQERSRLHAQAAALVASFRSARDHCLHQLEEEAVGLALAIAARVLRREAQADPLLLTGSVRVALGQLAASTVVRLRVPAADQSLWAEAILRMPGLVLRPQVVGDPNLELGECRMETELGNANLGLWAQLKAIEKGFFERPETQSDHSPVDGGTDSLE